jgi:hypothetical protein
MKYAKKIQNSKFLPRRQAGKIQNKILEFKIEEDLRKALKNSLAEVGQGETLYVLPTYSAMLEVRKIISGKKIL